MITVVICIRQENLRINIQQQLVGQNDFYLIAVRDQISAALPMVLNLEPDLFILEDVPDFQITFVLNHLKRHRTHTQTIVLNTVFLASNILQLLRLGVWDVLPAPVSDDAIVDRLSDFSAFYAEGFSEQQLLSYHNRISDHLLFNAILMGEGSDSITDLSKKCESQISNLQLDGWFQTVYISMNSDSSCWPDYCISELKIIEAYLRFELKDQFRSFTIITGNMRLILILNQTQPFGSVEKICRNIQDYCFRETGMDYDLIPSFGIGLCAQGLSGLVKSVRTARYASLVRLSEGNGKIIAYDRYYGNRENPLDFLTNKEKKCLYDSVISKDADQCIRTITDIFSTASSSQFILKAVAVVMIACEAFEEMLTLQNTFSSEDIEVLQSLPPSMHLLKDSVQVERELKNWVIKCFYAMNDHHESEIPEKITLAKHYIAENYQHEISLQNVADYVELSVPYFCSMFHKVCKISFVKYLNQMRLQRAAELLPVTEQKISEIAAIAGFQDARHFSRSFQKEYGKTPSEYRRLNQKNETDH